VLIVIYPITNAFSKEYNVVLHLVFYYYTMVHERLTIKDIKVKAPILTRVHNSLRWMSVRRFLEFVEEVLR